jgi:hypothetical protein
VAQGAHHHAEAARALALAVAGVDNDDADLPVGGRDLGVDDGLLALHAHPVALVEGGLFRGLFHFHVSHGMPLGE